MSPSPETDTTRRNGPSVVWALFAGVVVLAGIGWWGVEEMRGQIDAQAENLGVPRLSRQEAAERVAREDKFGLPSRLDQPPPRDIEKFRKQGTPAQPLPATEDGLRDMFTMREVTLKGCRKATKPGQHEAGFKVSATVTLETLDAFSHVRAITVTGAKDPSWDRFTQCVIGGVQDAVFEATTTTSNFALHIDVP